MISITDLMKSLNVEKYPERWDKIYHEVMKEYEIDGAFFADEEYITKLNYEFCLFDDWFETILKAAKQVRENPNLSKYIYLLYHAMQDRNAFPSEIKEITPPLAPVGTDTYAYDFLLLFAVLPTIPKSAQAMKNRGVPENVFNETLKSYERLINLTNEIYGKPGLSFKRYLGWIQIYIDAEILGIGRLNFNVCKHFNGCVYVLKNKHDEIKMLMTGVRLHKGGMVFGSPGYQNEELAYDADFCETDEYFEGYPVGDDGLAGECRIRLSKTEWRIVLSPEDSVIGVHIPSAKHGGRLSEEACEDSYTNAREIFSRCYPEYDFKAFTCGSWLMDNQLGQFLSGDSGIMRFQRKYLLYPRPATDRAVFSFLFTKPFEKLEELPEDTSLQRAIKYHYLNGKYIYEQGGVFF
jgi:hypothetical protein